MIPYLSSAEAQRSPFATLIPSAGLPAHIIGLFRMDCFYSNTTIHDKGDGNPHAHILLTTRKVDKNGFTQKERAWNDKKLLIEWRERWAEWCNHKLYFVSDARVDHRSYKDQGVDRLPQIHLGVEVCAVERKGFKTEKGNKNRRIRRRNLEVEIAELEQQLRDLRSEHKQEIIDYIEANIGCKVSDAFTIHENQAVLEQYEKFLQSRNIPCELIFYNEDKYELFVPKSEKEKALGLLTSYKKQHHERDNQSNTQHRPIPPKKPKLRI